MTQKRIAEASADANVEQSHKDGSTMRSSTTINTVSDFCSFVKRVKIDFHVRKPYDTKKRLPL